MLTVARFIARQENPAAVLEVRDQIMMIRPGIYTVIRRHGDGFNCDVFEGSVWEDHKRAILSFADEFERPIVEALRLGAYIVFDVAITSEDMGSGRFLLMLHAEPECLALLGSRGLALEFSIYCPDIEGK